MNSNFMVCCFLNIDIVIHWRYIFFNIKKVIYWNNLKKKQIETNWKFQFPINLILNNKIDKK